MFIEKPPSRIHKEKRLVHGIGINDANYVVDYQENGMRVCCPYYKVWKGLLDRCFDATFHKKRPSYKGCTVVSDWLIFSNFKSWMQTQNWENKALDKDLLNWANKQYGPDTCLFITPALNNLLTLRNNARGDLPLGVSRLVIKGYAYYVASCSFYGKQKRLGYFKTVEEAAEAYKTAKLNYIKELAEAEQDPRIKQALLALH
mgnify:FL=1